MRGSFGMKQSELKDGIADHSKVGEKPLYSKTVLGKFKLDKIL